MGVRFLGDLITQKKVGVGEAEKDEPTLSYTEIFYRCLPQFLVMGMSADEFWNCDPRMYRAYREKDRIEKERKNELLWLSGIYIGRAISSCFSNEDEGYPTEPFDIGLREKKEETPAEEMTKEEIQRTPQFVAVLDWAYKVNKQKRGENDGR